MKVTPNSIPDNEPDESQLLSNSGAHLDHNAKVLGITGP